MRLPAEPAFHYTFIIAFLAISKGWRAVGSDVGHAGDVAFDLKARRALPHEVARVEAPV